MNFLNSPITSEKFEKKAQLMYKLGKCAMFTGVAGLVLGLLIGLISVAVCGYFHYPFIFYLASGHGFVIPFVIIVYLALLVGLLGPALYISGMLMFGIARIAVNTENK